MKTVPPSYSSRRRGMGDALPPVASPNSAPATTATVEPPTLTGELVDAIPDAPTDAPPSTYAVVDLLDGRDGSVVRLAGLTLLRTAFIFPGIFIANKITGTEMTTGKVMGYSLATSASISAGMVAWYALRRRFPSRASRASVGT